jgi:hypothetical protein
MIGNIKGESDHNGLRHFSAFRDMPQLRRGGEYLLFLTAESSIALSSPVGLAQGCFDIDTSAPEEPTANRVNNAGLAADMARGPVPYADLAERLRTIISGKGDKR